MSLPKEIIEVIKNDAEAYGEKTGKYLLNNRNGYKTGATAWAEIAIGFANWCGRAYSKIEKDDEGNEWRENLLGRFYTTSELLTIYIEQLKK